MSPLRTLLELYKLSITQPPEDFEVAIEDAAHVGGIELPPPPGVEEFKEPTEGDVIELISPDGGEMIFLVYEVNEEKGMTQFIPLSRWIEFATPADVLVKLNGKSYIAQTDLSLDLPLSNPFRGRKAFIIGKLSQGDMEKIGRVIRGEEKGAGRMSGGVKREFKRLEAKRYLPLFLESIEEEERLQELEAELMSYKERFLAAAEQEQTWGDKDNLSWVYDTEEEVLNIVLPEELAGREGKVILELGDKSLTLYEGTLEKEIRIPISREAYSYRALKEGLNLAISQ
ncbi:hypothetical protein [Hydrogenivirga sp.]